ncbi:ABC transporter permease [Legionella oakridgensis]|uniref:ABC-type dipeptide/oligopeptide/nickel transport systems, permease component n=2 Tax=Legionella oakridgensis TaxID=29423 RepID=W0B8F1_9GAMM|nr:ABC transporter permease [Legionella oakridgensis]AHE66793.1 ABC-type dipeptide/oligopeptide/nickel transport systems, permease component [Legionella oakridgensis ATCC 33761 = DSM 21215]ETO93507.1 ABC-type dipeptide/oligopeptide/nickel transport system, permease component [Legionella oakridgensis RV-2-2007]KTD39809.1 peptide ABC transporter permease [Legionella oakridgensis]STY19911.1 peptide ABC transporter, permease protein [Legionella longbeachae]
MTGYLIRRILYAIPILLGINILTFALFFMVNTPDDMARMQLGEKHISPVAIQQWKTQRGYDLPLFYNANASGLQTVTHTLFFKKSLLLFVFDFGVSDAGRDISYDISQRMWPSLAIAFPVLVFGMLANILFAMMMAFFRSSYLDLTGVIFCIILMSISTMFYIIGGQYLFGKVLRLVPISGYDDGLDSIKFVALPILVAVIGGLGAGSRWYRTLFLEEMDKDYVKTARAKGLSELSVLFRHILKNAMLPILTGVVVIIPSLFMGSLVLESFFGVPGLGNYIIDAIQQQDFAIVRAMVFLGSVLYIAGLILTDISYTLVDPRVRLQ